MPCPQGRGASPASLITWLAWWRQLRGRGRFTGETRRVPRTTCLSQDAAFLDVRPEEGGAGGGPHTHHVGRLPWSRVLSKAPLSACTGANMGPNVCWYSLPLAHADPSSHVWEPARGVSPRPPPPPSPHTDPRVRAAPRAAKGNSGPGRGWGEQGEAGSLGAVPSPPGVCL